MKNILATIFTILITYSANAQNAVNSSVYNSDSIKAKLQYYMENPQKYFDDVVVLKIKLDEANKTTQEISEEYLSLLDKKDSIINLYKTENKKLTDKMVAAGGTGEKITKKEAAIIAKEDKNGTQYRVQLSAFNKNDFDEFFAKSAKFFGIQKLDDKTVMDIRGFTSPDEAFDFSQKMRNLGFSGAFVTQYTDGYRDEYYDYLVSSGRKSPATLPGEVKTSSKLDYPDYVPQGYKDIIGEYKSENNLGGSSSSDGMSTSQKAASTPASDVTPIGKSQNNSSTPKKVYKPTDTQGDPSNGQLDAAFDKLFNQ